MLTQKVEFNVNDFVYVKLTTQGRYAWKQYHEEFGIQGAKLPEPDADGYTMFQGHELMNIFGPYMVMGRTPVFETTMLVTVSNPVRVVE